MAIYSYTGYLTDLAGNPYPEASPRLFVVADKDTWGPNGPMPAKKRVPVAIGAGGSFRVDLTASADTSPPVKYTLACEWLDNEGQMIGYADWNFTAYMGGGPIEGGVGAPISSIWVGREGEWPNGTPNGMYINKDTNEWGVK